MSVTRVRYREQQILRAADLAAEQAYRLAMRRRHAIGQHTWGIVSGLELETEDGRVAKVHAGVAVDGYGRMLIVPETRVLLTLEDLADTGFRDDIDVWLAYDRVAMPQADCREPDMHPRWCEEARLCLTWASHYDPCQPDDTPARFEPQESPPDDPARSWPVYLGRIGSLGFTLDDVEDNAQFVARIQERGSPVLRRLWRITPGIRAPYATAIISGLNALLTNPYLSAAFADVADERVEELHARWRNEPRPRTLAHRNRVILENVVNSEGDALLKPLAGDGLRFVEDMTCRPYAGLVGADIRAPSRRARLCLGHTAARARHDFVLSLAGNDENLVDRLVIDREGKVTINGSVTLATDAPVVLDQAPDNGSASVIDLPQCQRGYREADVPALGLAFEPLQNSPDPAVPWQIYQAHVEDKGTHTVTDQLRFQIPHPGDQGDPACYQVVFGFTKDGVFTPCLTVQADGTVIAHGNVTVEADQVSQGPIPADLNDPRFVALLQNQWLGTLSSGTGLVDQFYTGEAAFHLEFYDIPQRPPAADEMLSYGITITNNGKVMLSDLRVYETLTVNGNEGNPVVLTTPIIQLIPGQVLSFKRPPYGIPAPTTGIESLTVVITVEGHGPQDLPVGAQITFTVHSIGPN